MPCRHVALFVVLLVAAIGCAGILDFGPADESDPFFVPHNPNSDVIFPHDRHGGECSDCHPGIDPEIVEVSEVKDPGTLLRPAKESCFECHERGQACADCHRRMRPTLRPANHTLGFDRMHGKAAYAPAARCRWCHGNQGADDGCQRCHSQAKPVDHGPRWKNSMHGRAATHNRDRCWVCHRSDQCARCHTQLPETHTEAFRQGYHATIASRKLRSCYVCHSFERTCAQCHQ